MSGKSVEDIATTMISQDLHDDTKDDVKQQDAEDVNLLMSSSQQEFAEIRKQRWDTGVRLYNENNARLNVKYGYLVGNGSCGCFKKLRDKIGALLVFFLLLLPLLLFWLLMLILLFLVYMLLCRFNSYSFGDYVITFLGNMRIWLLTFKFKGGCFYSCINRIVGFAQLFDFFVQLAKNTYYESFLKWQRLFAGQDGSEAFPYLFALVTNNFEDCVEFIQKPEWNPLNSQDLKLRDRECKTFFTFELGPEVTWYGTGHVFSIADARHDIMRDIQYICLNIDGKEDYYDLEKYKREKYDPLMSKLPEDKEQWLGKYFKYPRCLKYALSLHLVPLFYRVYGIKLTDEEIEWFNKNFNVLALLPIADWFHTLMFNGMLKRKAFITIHRLASIIEDRCENQVLRNLKEYARKHGINERAVLYSASLMFVYAGGNIFTIIANRFKMDPRQEYIDFYKDPEHYVMEVIRTHAAVVRATSHLAHKEYNYMINGKLKTFPQGTLIAASITNINDNIASKNSGSFDINRRRTDYNEAYTWHCKDSYFRKDDRRLLNSRFCPGRAIIIHHLADVCKMLMESLKNHYRFDDDDMDSTNNFIDVEKIHHGLSLYNKVVVGALAPGIAKHNKDPSNDKIPDAIDKGDGKWISKFPKSSVFGKQLIKEDLYVQRSALKDSVFDIITNVEWLFPVEDDSTLFDENSLENSQKIMKKYIDVKASMPNVNVEWKDLKSDLEMSLFAFGGLVCGYTKLIDYNVKSQIPIPNGAVYSNDTTFLNDYEVRKGLHRYGACAYFDEHTNLIAIYVSHLESMVYCGSPKMKYAKYAWTTSVLAALTVIEHACQAHMVESNCFVTNVYTKLPFNHWLRRFSTPFTHRTVYINQSIHQVLLVKQGLVHRIWGFTYESINKIGTSVIANYKWVPYPERYDPALAKLDDKIFPLAQDSADFYEIMYNFVLNYVNQYMNDGEDKYAKDFYEGCCHDLNIDSTLEDTLFSKENLCKMVANLICCVTAFHEQVGSVFDNVCVELDWHDTKLYKSKTNKCSMSKNDYVATAILIMITGVRNPPLINDFTNVLLKDDKLDGNKQIFESWQNDLKMLSEKIDERNKGRRVPFNAVNPRVLESSLSI